jgi:hypothetical protein
MEETIQFIANCSNWKAVKKLKITDKTDPKTVLEFLASLSTGIDRKVEEQLGKIVKLEKLDNQLKEIFSDSKKSPEEIIRIVNGSKINKTIKEMVSSLTEMQSNEQKEISQFLKVYAMRKALKQGKIFVDYSTIEIPGMKKLMKTRV